MNWVSMMGMGVAVAIASTSALAFQEQSGTVPAAAPAAAPAEQPATEGKTAADLASSGGVVNPAEGTEVSIPGLGKLGVLPKMDFGLELLYGASETKQIEEERELPADDLTIRGTVKHKF